MLLYRQRRANVILYDGNDNAESREELRAAGSECLTDLKSCWAS